MVAAQEVTRHEVKLARTWARARYAQAELHFTTVRAPFDGTVGRFRQQSGSLVKEGDTLATLSDDSVVWVYFDVPRARYLDAMSDREPNRLPVALALADGKKLPQVGRLGAMAPFDQKTESIPVRADFPNPNHLLRHGQTGTVLVSRTIRNAVLIPQRATFEVGDRWYVFVLDKDDVAHQREIVVQDELEDRFVIEKGVDVGDRIVVDSVKQLHEGDRVQYEHAMRLMDPSSAWHAGTRSPKAPP